MKERFLTCIVCPKGCPLHVIFDEDGRIASVSGNTCKRGVVYAEDECTHPKRTVTSTVRLTCGEVVPVKTNGTVPKELVFEVMRAINAARPEAPINVGDVIIKNVCDTGVDVVASAYFEGK